MASGEAGLVKGGYRLVGCLPIQGIGASALLPDEAVVAIDDPMLPIDLEFRRQIDTGPPKVVQTKNRLGCVGANFYGSGS